MREVEAAKEILTELYRSGFVWLEAPIYDPARIAATIGHLLQSNSQAAEAKILRPYSKESAPRNSMSSMTGTDAQPLHTDCAYLPLPPRLILLHCVATGELDCPTVVWITDWKALLSCMPTVLKRPGWVVRGGGKRPTFYTQILNKDRVGRPFIRLDPCCMEAPEGHHGLFDEANVALSRFSFSREIHWVTGGMLLLDNWRCLHGRGAGADKAPSRRLRRWIIGE